MRDTKFWRFFAPGVGVDAFDGQGHSGKENVGETPPKGKSALAISGKRQRSISTTTDRTHEIPMVRAGMFFDPGLE